MTEQNPPGQPTPPNEPTGATEGDGPTANEGAAPPPPPPTPGTAVDDNPTPPPASSSRKPWVVGVAVLLVILLVAGGAVAAFTVFKKDNHAIAIPSTAAGMERDKDKETELKAQLDAAEKQFNEGKNVDYVRSAVFQQDDTDRGPKSSILFLGAVLKAEQSPTKWIDEKFIKPAESNGLKIAKVSAGDAGGQAVCAYLDTGQKGAICSWATKDSIGQVVPITPGYTREQVAKLMLDVREDVESTK
jgi:hypothetical protein